MKLDEFHYHEVLHLTHVINDLMYTELEQHVVFQQHKRLRNKIQKVEELLADIYQDIGYKQLKLTEKNEKSIL